MHGWLSKNTQGKAYCNCKGRTVCKLESAWAIKDTTPSKIAKKAVNCWSKICGWTRPEPETVPDQKDFQPNGFNDTGLHCPKGSLQHWHEWRPDMTKYTLLSFECDALGRVLLQKNGYLPDGARNWVLYRKIPPLFFHFSRQLLDEKFFSVSFLFSPPLLIWLHILKFPCLIEARKSRKFHNL